MWVVEGPLKRVKGHWDKHERGCWEETAMLVLEAEGLRIDNRLLRVLRESSPGGIAKQREYSKAEKFQSIHIAIWVFWKKEHFILSFEWKDLTFNENSAFYPIATAHAQCNYSLWEIHMCTCLCVLGGHSFVLFAHTKHTGQQRSAGDDGLKVFVYIPLTYLRENLPIHLAIIYLPNICKWSTLLSTTHLSIIYLHII